MTSIVTSVQSFGVAAAGIIATLGTILIIGIWETVCWEIKYFLDNGPPPTKKRQRRSLATQLVKVIDRVG